MDRSKITKSQRWKIADKMAEDILPIIDSQTKEIVYRETFYTKYTKRMFDLLISSVVLIITLPINCIIALFTYFDLGKPLFFKQKRVGKNEKLFTIVKFRNMKNIYDENGELLPAAERVTKLGKFLRGTSLDELLNFWNIFKGEMSLIGPRPLVPEYTHRYNKRHKSRLCVKPGLECPPRTNITHVWTWQEQLENDVWYVQNISFKTDCKMLFNLLRFALDRKSSKARVFAERGSFMGYNMNGRAINLDEVDDYYIDLLEKGLL